MQTRKFVFFLSAIIVISFSTSILAQQPDFSFYCMAMNGLEKYSIKGDTLTLEIDNLRLSVRRIDLEEKDLIVGKAIKGNYEIWYMKMLEGRFVRIGDYKMLFIERRANKNTFGVFASGTYPTLELCKYALYPKPADIYYFNCYAKPYFDTFQNLASFANADENKAKAVFEDMTTQMNLFLKEKSALKNYRGVAFKNFLTEAFLKNGFNPVIDEKSLGEVMYKYHIK